MSGKYNGFANYQTWNVNLWLSNGEGAYREAQKYRAELILQGHRGFNAERAKAFVAEVYPQGTPDLEDRDKPFAGVRWSEVSSMLNELTARLR